MYLTRRKDSERPEMIPVKMRPLRGEAFRRYGQVLERGVDAAEVDQPAAGVLG